MCVIVALGNRTKRGITQNELCIKQSYPRKDKVISKAQIEHAADTWSGLQAENYPLRLVVTSRLMSVEESFIYTFICLDIDKFPEVYVGVET